MMEYYAAVKMEQVLSLHILIGWISEHIIKVMQTYC